MIPGCKPLKVKSFLYIDHCAKGIEWSTPKYGETSIGIPHGWYGDNCLPFIEVHKDGKLSHTINCADLTAIEFE
jgi:hypothetical protein